MYFYDKKTNGFYIEGLHVITDDMSKVTQEYYEKLIGGQSNGKQITSDEQGCPILIDPAPSQFHELKNGEWKITKAKQKEQLNAEKTRLILFTADKVDAIKSALLSGYPQTEIDSFYRQEKEALAYKANKKADTPMLKMIAQARGVQFDLLVQKVIEKSNQFAVAIGVIIGQRQAFEDRILAAENVEQLSDIEREVTQWQFTLES